MTKAAKVWAGILLGIVIGLFAIAAVGSYMVVSLREAEQDRKLLLEGNARVQAVTDCIIDATPEASFRECLERRLPPG